jgi:hypothetical protein
MNKIIRSALLACGLAGYALTAAAAPAVPVRVDRGTRAACR